MSYYSCCWSISCVDAVASQRCWMISTNCVTRWRDADYIVGMLHSMWSSWHTFCSLICSAGGQWGHSAPAGSHILLLPYSSPLPRSVSAGLTGYLDLLTVCTNTNLYQTLTPVISHTSNPNANSNLSAWVYGLIWVQVDRKHRWLGHVLRHENLLHVIIEGKMLGKGYSW